MFKDLTGLKFGKLTVIERVENYVSPKGSPSAQWRCSCDCGDNDNVIVSTARLTRGVTKSCGCLRRDLYGKQNDCEIKGYYATLYTELREPFYVDLEDLPKVLKVYWYKDKDGYLVGKRKGKIIKLHRYIMGFPKGKKVDHLGGENTRHDNRRYNLRVATSVENAQNRKRDTRNKSGTTGVCKKGKRWVAYISIDGKQITLGSFVNIEDAIKTRKEAESKYYKEWSYDNSQEAYQNAHNDETARGEANENILRQRGDEAVVA